MTRRSTAVEEREELGLLSWSTMAVVTKERERWRDLVCSPISHPGKRNKVKSNAECFCLTKMFKKF